jgi:hypothetical protein
MSVRPGETTTEIAAATPPCRSRIGAAAVAAGRNLHAIIGVV